MPACKPGKEEKKCSTTSNWSTAFTHLKPKHSRQSCFSRSRIQVCLVPPPFHCGTMTVGPRQFNDLWSHDKNQDTSRTSAALDTPGRESYLVWSCQQTRTHSSYSYLQDARIPMEWCREEAQRREGVGVEKAFHSIQQEDKKEGLEVQKRERDGES